LNIIFVLLDALRDILFFGVQMVIGGAIIDNEVSFHGLKRRSFLILFFSGLLGLSHTVSLVSDGGLLGNKGLSGLVFIGEVVTLELSASGSYDRWV